MLRKVRPFVILECLSFDHNLLSFRLDSGKGEDLSFENDRLFVRVANHVVELFLAPFDLYFERRHLSGPNKYQFSVYGVSFSLLFFLTSVYFKI